MKDITKSTSFTKPIVGVFDSGIGGFSVLIELFKVLPAATYYYYSDEAHSPYGDKSDLYIKDRCFLITEELLSQGAEIIVIACNTATAVSIEALRAQYSEIEFVGIEPYLKAYNKIPGPNKMVVLTTESMGHSERFKNLKARLDPQGLIDHVALKNLATIVETFFHNPQYEARLDQDLQVELAPLQDKNYTHAILGCTHYPLVRDNIEKILHLQTLSPCPFVAARVRDLILKKYPSSALSAMESENHKAFFFKSSKEKSWRNLQRSFQPRCLSKISEKSE